jgi:hypothetical protein
MWKLAYVHLIFLAFLAPERASCQCSNGALTIEKYSPVPYLVLPRISGHQYDVRANLTVAPNGSILPGDWTVLRLDGAPADETKDPTSWFLQPVQDALKSWRFTNETGRLLSIRLSVEFRLVGDRIYGDEQRNQIILRDDELLIKVIAKPRMGVIP